MSDKDVTSGKLLFHPAAKKVSDQDEELKEKALVLLDATKEAVIENPGTKVAVFAFDRDDSVIDVSFVGLSPAVLFIGMCDTMSQYFKGVTR